MKTTSTSILNTKTHQFNLDNSKIKKHLYKKFIVITFIGLFAVSLIYSLLETYLIENKYYTLSSFDIPISFDGTRIVFLSDIHHGLFFSKARIRNVVKQANSLKPDLILLGGDYVKGSPIYIEPCFSELKNLHASLGVFGVLGNHDHWQGAELSRKAMKNSEINSIDNNSLWVTKDNQKIKIGGVGDHCEDVQKLDATVSDVSKTDFVILVSHNPDYAQELKSDKVDLVLSGHTHGGQITFFGLFAYKIPSHYGQKFRTGKVIIDKIQVIISNGIGTVSLPLRFFARPQIVIVELRYSK